MKNRWLQGMLMTFYLAAAVHCGMADESLTKESNPNSPGQGTSSGSSSGIIDNEGAEILALPFNGATDRLGVLSPGEQAFDCSNLPQQAVVLSISADDSNSMASPVYAREMLRLAVPKRPKTAALRLSEFLNYYNVLYPFPVNKEPEVYLAAQVEAGQPNSYRFQAGVQAPQLQINNPMVLTAVVDTSYSMKGEGMLRAKAALNAIVGSLVPGDQFTLLNWKTAGGILIDNKIITTGGAEKAEILNAIMAIKADGGVDPKEALQRAYENASTHFSDSKHNRVVFISDGQSSPLYEQEQRELIQKAASDGDQEGIYLVGVATGPAEGHGDALMDALTESGKGAYVYLDSEQEAARMFGARYSEIMAIAARNVQVTMTLPWYFNAEEIFAEVVSSSGPPVEAQHLGMGDSMIFNQIIHSCLPVDTNMAEPIDFTLAWIDPVSRVPGQITRQAMLQTLLAAPDPEQSKLMAKANAVIAYAKALIAPQTPGLMAEAQARIELALDLYGTEKPDPDLEEIDALLRRHPDYK